MPAPEAKPGTQKQSVVSELNTPAADAARAERTEDVLSGDEILHASDRSKVMERYRQHERKELSDMGIDADKLDEELDALGDGDEEKPEGEEEEHAAETPEDEEEVAAKKPEDADKEVADGEEEGDEAEPEDAKGYKLDDILAVRVPVKIDGVEGEATVADMQKSYQLQGHLTRKLQEVARTQADLQNYAQQVTAAKAQVEAEFKEYEEQLFSPEEIKARQRDRERVAQEQQNAYSNTFLQCRTLLYQRHPDADQLDYDPGFVEFRQKEAPLVNEQMLARYGPGVFFPAVDLLLTSYKRITALENELKGVKTTKESVKTERVNELKAREAQQREQKKKTSKDVKPSTTKTDTGGDDSSDSDGGRNYVRKMKENRFRLQGLTPQKAP
jgi:hypothetical protein